MSKNLIIIIVVILVILGGLFAFFGFNNDKVVTPQKDTGSKVEVNNQEATNSGSADSEVLAGNASKLYVFNKAAYGTALQSDKLVVLYFYANWCPICRAEVPKMYEAFNELTTDQVVGFRVNFNDDETNEDEKNLAREHGVAYQHTKVFIKNGQRVLKSPESWDKQRYLDEIEKAL